VPAGPSIHDMRRLALEWNNGVVVRSTGRHERRGGRRATGTDRALRRTMATTEANPARLISSDRRPVRRFGERGQPAPGRSAHRTRRPDRGTGADRGVLGTRPGTRAAGRLAAPVPGPVPPPRGSHLLYVPGRPARAAGRPGAECGSGGEHVTVSVLVLYQRGKNYRCCDRSRLPSVPNGDDVPSSAIIRIPTPWRADLDDLFVRGDFKVRVESGDGVVRRIRTQENESRIAPSLITVEDLAGPTVRNPRLDRVQDVEARNNWTVALEDHDDEIERLRGKAERSKAFVDFISFWRSCLSLAPIGNLSDTLEGVYETLTQLPLESNATERPFASAGIHFIQRSPVLVSRTRLAAVMLRIQNDSSLAAGQVEHLVRAMQAGDTVFSSSAGLMEGSTLIPPYLAPVLGALSPYVWAFESARPAGAIIVSFGNSVVGTGGEATELLHMLPQRGSLERTPRTKLSRGASSSALAWWIQRVDRLFGILTDPGVFSDDRGEFVAVRQVHALATVEQLFRRVGAIHTSYRDDSVRQVLLFTVLDTLERLQGRPIEDLCSLVFVEKTLGRLEAAIPKDAAEILLPAARRAVGALKGVQDGFFISRQANSDRVNLQYPDGRVESLSLDRAAALYVKLLRNATHGHGGNRRGVATRSNALLAHHNGYLPHDLALLGYVYLLDILVRLDDLRVFLHRSGSRVYS
jgi:hypothetical protein